MNNDNYLIGILGHQHSGSYNNGYGQNAAYVEFFRQYGDVIIIDSQCEQVLPIDLLVLPGGRDVNPERYGQKPLIGTQNPDLEYEWFFKYMFKHYLTRATANKTAIYGICAGFQNLIVEFGGTLAQSAAQKQSTDWRGELVDFLDFNNEVIKKHEILKDLHQESKNDQDYKKTNSIHHQSAYKEDIPEGFDILATNKNYNNIEFIIHEKFPIAAEQSHPEERLNPLLTDGILKTILKMIV